MKSSNYSASSLVVIGDWHIGHQSLDYELLKSDLAYAKKKRAKVIILGDLIENAIPNCASSQFESNMHPEEQMELAIELLRPIRTQIVGIHSGNHSYRTLKAAGIDPEKIIAKELGVPFFGSQHLWKLNGYTIYSAHGVGGGTTPTGRLNALLKLSKLATAEIYLMGHIHSRIVHKEMKITPQGERTILFATCGSYLKYDESYASRMLLAPGKMGMCEITFGTEPYVIF